jgi:uncharacterized protein (TIGR03086 family)
MTDPELFVLADHTLSGVVSQIRDNQWAMSMPPSFARRQVDHVPTLREVVNYHAYDDAWVPDMLAGRTMEASGRSQFDGDLLGDDPKVSFAAIVERACSAAIQLDDLERIVHCSFGDFPAREYFWQVTMFRGLRAHDIADVIGVDSNLPVDLVEGIWAQISPHAEEWRALGVFPAAVPVAAEAPLQDRLLGLTGRDPNG